MSLDFASHKCNTLIFFYQKFLNCIILFNFVSIIFIIQCDLFNKQEEFDV